MTPPRNRLADTIRQPAKKTASTPVKDTLRNDEEEKTKLTRRTTVYLSEQTWKDLKISAVEDEKNVSQIIENLVEGYLMRRERRIAKAQEK
ncbi:hypothetical protein HMPREF0290_3009 [Corynebacterium efficiens YS-314]|uniref:hypothetical protein n=1 Tax=Corynebacterium efficiens TaxID=152794 RepID=UPI0001B86C51|nr:hypothetical protein [Corynebacterium efficiens]EEW48383.1 hypothetical protein HMPREF0290_3009 [Corynebacterium efficiens YS-314]